MKSIWRFVALAGLALALLAPLAFARPAFADHCVGDKQVFGGNYALAAARALAAHSGLSAADIVRRSLEIAGDICVYTNRNIVIEELP